MSAANSRRRRAHARRRGARNNRPAGGTLAINVSGNGTARVDLGGTIKMVEPTACVSGTLSPPGADHYRVEAEASPSMMHPISGEFDLTP
jgi:hypothetical protein